MKLKKYSRGKYSTYKGHSSYNSIEKWILEQQFLEFEKDELLLSKKSRRRNKLYSFHSIFTDSNVIMKVSEISKKYSFWRRIDLFITGLFKDYNFNSYKGSIKLREAGINTLNPIAYWTYKNSWLNRKSYFLYEKVESDFTVTELCNDIISSNAENKHELINTIAQKCVEIVKNIHAANIRHDDPHGGNFLTNLFYNNINDISLDDIKNATFTLIDNDRCTYNRSKTTILKRFYDLKCLRRFNICQIPQEELLKNYLGGEYTKTWWYVLNFWKSGGFSVKQQIKYLLK